VFLSDDRLHDLCMHVHNNIIVNVCARHKYQLEVIFTVNKGETILVFKPLMIILRIDIVVNNDFMKYNIHYNICSIIIYVSR
jgi:hypothetical protein